MRLYTKHGEIDGIHLHAFVVDGKILLEGKYWPDPRTESKITGDIDFSDAQRLVETLTSALKSVPCPHCGRKEPAK